MKKISPQPCSTWAEHLAARHPSDLSTSERAALKAHLQTCPACASVSTAYTLMEAAIHQLPPVTPLASLTSDQLEQRNTQKGTTFLRTPFNGRTDSPRSRPTLVRQLANQFAAILVVGALIVASLVLFTHHHASTQVGGAAGVSESSGASDIAPQPIPSGLCENADPGLKQLCTQHSLTKIDSSKLLASVPVTLAYAYADSNRVSLLSFVQPSKPFTPSQQLMWSEFITTQNGLTLDSAGGSGENNFYYADYDAATVPSGTQSLVIHCKATYYDTSKSNAPLAFATFTFTIPFHAAHIATPAQTITLRGLAITLDRVVIAPSSTRVYLHGGPTVPGSPTLLKVGNTTIDGNRVPGRWQPSTPYTTDALFEYDVSLYDKQGTWTFTIKPPGGRIYVFRFSVPL